MIETEEGHTMQVVRYRDKAGVPTCAMDFDRGKVCKFYMSQKWGTHETCVFAEYYGKYWEPLKRRENGVGNLIPLKQCPIWKGEK